MSDRTYYAPHGGHPGQDQLMTGRAVFTEAYAFIPKGVMRDIVTSFLPGWDKTRLWVIARPLSGFAETFSQYIMEVQPGGGSARAETDPNAHAVLFVTDRALCELPSANDAQARNLHVVHERDLCGRFGLASAYSIVVVIASIIIANIGLRVLSNLLEGDD